MAENPLLPNAELQNLLVLTKRCVGLERAAGRRAARANLSTPAPPAFREALLSATILQLKHGDLLVAEPADEVANDLFTGQEPDRSEPLAMPKLGRNTPRLLLAAAMAGALRQAGTEGIVLAYIRERASEPHWEAALSWAQEKQLPLILACADPRGERAFRADLRAPKDAFSWQAVQRTAGRLKLPVLTLDGEDAVAVYRAMQESVLRARSGGGPAILWAMLSDPATQVARKRSGEPLGRLQRYLRSRGIPF